MDDNGKLATLRARQKEASARIGVRHVLLYYCARNSLKYHDIAGRGRSRRDSCTRTISARSTCIVSSQVKLPVAPG